MELRPGENRSSGSACPARSCCGSLTGSSCRCCSSCRRGALEPRPWPLSVSCSIARRRNNQFFIPGVLVMIAPGYAREHLEREATKGSTRGEHWAILRKGRRGGWAFGSRARGGATRSSPRVAPANVSGSGSQRRAPPRATLGPSFGFQKDANGLGVWLTGKGWRNAKLAPGCARERFGKWKPTKGSTRGYHWAILRIQEERNGWAVGERVDSLAFGLAVG